MSLLIDGKLTDAAGGAVLPVVNPATEDKIGRVADAQSADVERAVAAARRCFDTGAWGALSLDERAAAIRRVMEIFAPRIDEATTLLCSEMGAPVSGQGGSQVRALPDLVEAQITHALNYPWSDVRPGPWGGQTLVEHRPVGVVAAIVPWNGPLFVMLQKIVPALMAGCTTVVKAAPEAPLALQVFAEAVAEAGLPNGAINILQGGVAAGAALVAADVDMVSFTGSTRAGKLIAAECAKSIKRCALELGGKSAAILLEDGDVEQLSGAVLASAFGSNGQQCFALSRALVPQSRYDETVDALTIAVGALRVGDPLDPSTEIGPVITGQSRDRIVAMFERATSAGAKATTGGGRPDGFDRGYYVEPTVFAGATRDSEIAREEVFGPAVTVLPYVDESDAIALANDTVYGLNGAVFSTDEERARGVIRRLRTGMATVNGFMTNWNAPFGGFKQSGIGREYGPEGVKEFLEYQSIHSLA